MAEDVKIFDGTNWKSLVGPEGPTVVSADLVNVARLGTDGKLLVAQADLDARYVNITGDTMTGQLIVKPTVAPATPDGAVQVIGDNALAHITIQRNADLNSHPALRFKRSRGTTAAPTPPVALDGLGAIAWHVAKPDGTYAGAGTIQSILVTPPANGDTQAAAEMRFVTALNTTTTQVAMTITGGTTAGTSGVTMTYGNVTALTVSNAAYINGPQFHAPTYGFGALMTPKSPSATGPLTGYNTQLTDTAPSQTSVCYLATHGGFGKDFNAGYACSQNLAAGTNNYAFYSSWDAQNYFKGFTGINWSNPTSQLEVGGNTTLRGTLDVTGNITSTGTAHSFAAKSIPASAINGVPAIKADDLTDVTVTTPAAGQVLRWNGTAFVNAALNYSDLTGTAPGGGTPSTVPAAPDAVAGAPGTSTAYARADHQHPYPTAANVGAVALSGLNTITGPLRLQGTSFTECLTVTIPTGFNGTVSSNGAVVADTRNTGVSGYSNPVAAFFASTSASPVKPNEYAFLSQGAAPSLLGGALTVTGTLVGDRPYLPLTSGPRTLALADKSSVVANVSTGAVTTAILIPDNAAVPFPIGTLFQICGLSTTSSTTVTASAGVTLNWNATLTGGASAAAGGVAASLVLTNPYVKITLIKTATNTWVATT